eukprot:g13924.t1
MRAANTFLALAGASITVSPVMAFLFPLSCAPVGCRVGAFSGRRVKTRLPGVACDNPLQEADLPLPPRDETFNPFASLQELLMAPDVVGGRYDRVGNLTGGIWRSIVIGFLPATVITLQQGDKWMEQQEAAGNVYQKWPQSVVQILGEKALNNLSVQPQLHGAVRKICSKALSPKAVVGLQPFVETVVKRKMLKFERLANSGQEVVVQDEMSDVTMESIAGVFFGEYATPEVLERIKRLLPVATFGLFSIPVRFPWPLNQYPVFGYGKAMDARKALTSEILKVLEERRAELDSAEGETESWKSAGLLDSFIETQRNEMCLEEGQDGSFDDDFIVDNLLATADDGKEIVEKLIQELRNDVTSNDDELDDTAGTGSSGASRAGTFEGFPLLDAVVLEVFRMQPAVGSVFRKTRVDVNYNGYLIPEGETINWSMIHGFRAESLYPEAEKFCPFRFLHGDNINDQGASSKTSPGEMPAEQPRPPMFGSGRHICPGRELAKLEMLLLLKEFLPKFDYQLVEGQSFQGVLPVNGPKDKLRVILKLKSAT